MARDAASSRQHVTQFTLRPGDRVSYDSQEYTLLSIDASTPTNPAKAVIRLVSHEHVATRTVRYASLRPLASPRPEHMHSSVTCDSMDVGKFVFFSSGTSTDVLGGTVTRINVDAQKITVHEHRQANIATRRFTPLYTNTTNLRIEQRVKPLSHHAPVLHDVRVSHVHAVGTVERYHIEQTLLDSLRAMGVMDA